MQIDGDSTKLLSADPEAGAQRSIGSPGSTWCIVPLSSSGSGEPGARFGGMIGVTHNRTRHSPAVQ